MPEYPERAVEWEAGKRYRQIWFLSGIAGKIEHNVQYPLLRRDVEKKSNREETVVILDNDCLR
jgi:hypothetical protein